MKILVTGATGQLGNELKRLAKNYPQHKFIFSSTKDLDLTDLPRVADYIRFEEFDLIINTAAYTAVDRAEVEPQAAYMLNRDAVFNMVQAAEWVGTKIIHISTDYVFDGTKSTPYTEDDPINPLSVYAKSKAEGEIFVAKYSGGMIIRTSWLYSAYGHNFVKTMLRLAKEKQRLTVVFDQIGTPTWAYELAKAILYVVDLWHSGKIKFPSGIYHFSNEGVASWYDFAYAIFDLAGIDIELVPIETKDLPRPAKRPHFSVLNKAKFRQTFGYKIPHWLESLKLAMKEIVA